MVSSITWDGHSLFTNVTVAGCIPKNSCVNTCVPISPVTTQLPVFPLRGSICVSSQGNWWGQDCSNQDKLMGMVLDDFQGWSYKECGFHLALTWMFALGTQLTILWRRPSQETPVWGGAGPPASSQHPPPDQWGNKASGHSTLQDFRCCGAERNCGCWTSSEFLTHQMHEHDKWLFYSAKF